MQALDCPLFFFVLPDLCRLTRRANPGPPGKNLRKVKADPLTMPIYSIEWEYNTTTTKGLTMKYNEEEPMGYDELVNWLSENHYEVFCQWAQIVEE